MLLLLMPQMLLLLMCVDVAQIWKRWVISVKCFEVEVRCVFITVTKLKGKGEVMFDEVVGKMFGIGSEVMFDEVVGKMFGIGSGRRVKDRRCYTEYVVAAVSNGISGTRCHPGLRWLE